MTSEEHSLLARARWWATYNAALTGYIVAKWLCIGMRPFEHEPRELAELEATKVHGRYDEL